MSTPTFAKIPRQAKPGVKIFLLAVLVVGLSVGAFWHARHNAIQNLGTGRSGLSAGTMTVLKNLGSPAEIHFYSVLDQASVPADTFAFADRINQLLAEYQSAGDGKVSVTRFQKMSDANAASAEGLKPFNLDKGDACYLGLSVTCNGQKESFALLSADWEPALEADLSRAITRLSATKSATQNSPAVAAAPDSAAIESVKRALPNLATMSVEEGSQALRATALEDFQKAAAEMEVQVQAARQSLADAQNGGSKADQQAAMKHFQEVQAAQSEKLKAIAAKLQSQINALEQIKKQ